MIRCAIFIDGEYLDKTAKGLGKYIDYQKLPDYVARGSRILRTYYYSCRPYQSPSPTDDERERASKKDRFFHFLSGLPSFDVRLGKVAKKPKPTHFQQKGVDAQLSIDMVRLSTANRIDEAILISGDSDFIPAVRAAKEEGVKVILWHGPRGKGGSCPEDLWKLCDERHLIGEHINLIERNSS